MLGSWYPEFVYIHVFVGIHETKNNNQEDSKHQTCFKFHPFNCKNIAYKSIQLETCFGKLSDWMSQGCPHLALTPPGQIPPTPMPDTHIGTS